MVYYREVELPKESMTFEVPYGLVPGYMKWDLPDMDDNSGGKPSDSAALSRKDAAILPWDASSHDTLLFDSDTGQAYLLSSQPYGLRNHRMTAATRDLLLAHDIILPKSVSDLSAHMYDILRCVTGVRRSTEEAQQLMQGTYCLTPDNLLKILALYVRVRCGLPIALMGECGCGKTMLLRYLCAWLDVPLRILDVHGGTTEADILRAVSDAEALAEEEWARRQARQAASPPRESRFSGSTLTSGPQEPLSRVEGAETQDGVSGGAEGPATRGEPLVFLFLDEVNTCPHLGLVHELLCRRSVHGRLVRDGLLILTALNPRRKRGARDEGDTTPGLVYSAEQAVTDDMADLVYRVHPVSQTLLNFVFDFGALGPHVEQAYIESMVHHADPDASKAERELMTSLILNAQTFIRTTENDSSAASLRDVRRCLDLFTWFKQKLSSRPGSRISSSGVCLTLGCVLRAREAAAGWCAEARSFCLTLSYLLVLFQACFYVLLSTEQRAEASRLLASLEEILCVSLSSLCFVF